LSSSFVIIWGIVIWKVGREYAAESTEVPATWFGILNSLFIVGFARLFQNGGKVNIIFQGNEIWTRTYLVRIRFWIFSVWKYGY
jgi:hypothetical protein